MELRSKRNSIRGPIALIQKGSGHIVGVANIGDSIGPMDFADFVPRKNEHGVEESRLQQVFDSGRTIRWKLSDVQRLRTAIPYVHKPGAVTWVTLDATAIAGLQKASPSRS